MEFTADKILIKDFFSGNKQYTIPRYQREYSWEEKQLDDFYRDIVDNINFSEESRNTDYFFGTVMLVGDMIQHKEPLQIVDGQQRITTMTIFFSALAKVAEKFDKKISNNIWRYIIGCDEDGEDYKVLENLTASPYFEDKIQSRNSEGIYSDSILEGTEQYKIQYAYDFFLKKLSADVNNFSQQYGLAEIEIIKIIRSQLTGSQVIYICSHTEEDVNKIFENINSKGQKLYTLDLIKNEIFSVENELVPIDKAKEFWSQIKNNLISDREAISVDTFYRHFWISNYGQSKMSDLYDNFLSTIKPKDYYKYLKKLRDSSRNYMLVVSPTDNMFQGHSISKKDIARVKNILNNITVNFRITQARIFILVAYEKYMNNQIKFKDFQNIIEFIEEFHYVHNAICKQRNNKLENKYGSYARKLRKAADRGDWNRVINGFKDDFKSLLPDKKTFIDHFVSLTYKKKSSTAKQNQLNVVAKYSIKKYEEILHGSADYDYLNESIEHIVSESENPNICCHIGNLTLLEENLNKKSDDEKLSKKIELYGESKYCSTRKFLEEYSDKFSQTDFDNRARTIGEVIYNGIIVTD